MVADGRGLGYNNYHVQKMTHLESHYISEGY
mgnify:CR=1 FL=1